MEQSGAGGGLLINVFLIRQELRPEKPAKIHINNIGERKRCHAHPGCQ
jgi:hypothetical protein